MSQSPLPDWLSRTSLQAKWERNAMFAAVKGAWTRPIPIGNALLVGVGLAGVIWVARDMSWYYSTLPKELSGLHRPSPLVYLISSLTRTFRWARGMDGTRTAGIYHFVRTSKVEMFHRRFLKDDELPLRRGPRPIVLHEGIPDRQVPQVMDPELTEKLQASLRAFPSTHSSVTIGESPVERHALALFLPFPSTTSPPHPELTRLAPNGLSSADEFAHIHGDENSLHVVLAPLDAAEVIEKGWGARFPLAGMGMGIPQGRVLVYAPRDEAELKVILRIIEVGYEYLTAKPAA